MRFLPSVLLGCFLAGLGFGPAARAADELLRVESLRGAVAERVFPLPGGAFAVAGHRTDRDLASGLPLVTSFLLRVRDGKPDSAFGDGGVRLEPGLRQDFAVTAEGPSFAAGGTVAAENPTGILVRRLQPDGRLDRDFGMKGIGDAVFEASADVASRVVVHGDGVVVAAGDTGAVVLARFGANGRSDRGFGDSGARRLELGAAPAAAGIRPELVLLEAIGSELRLAGNFGAPWVAALGRSGRVDVDFGKRAGRFLLDTVGAASLAGAAVSERGLVGAGLTKAGAGFVLRLGADGAADASFASGKGFVLFEDFRPTAVAVAGDGAVLLGGSAGAEGPLVLRRVRGNGEPDPTFATAGVWRSSADLRATSALAVEADGRLLVVATVRAADGSGPPVVLRFSPDGRPTR